MTGKTNAIKSSSGDKGLEGLLYSSNNFNFSNNPNTPNEIEVSLPFVQTSISQIGANLPSNVTKVKLTANNTITNMYRAFFRKDSLVEVEINFDTSLVTNWDYAFAQGGIKTISGLPLNLSNCTNGNFIMGGDSQNFGSVRFIEGTIFIGLTFPYITQETYTSLWAGLATLTSTQELRVKNQQYGTYYDDTDIANATAKGWTVIRYN
jgi:hypothetical protein